MRTASSFAIMACAWPFRCFAAIGHAGRCNLAVFEGSLFAGFLLLDLLQFPVESMLEIRGWRGLWALFLFRILNLQSPEGSYEDHQPGRRPSPVH